MTRLWSVLFFVAVIDLLGGGGRGGSNQNYYTNDDKKFTTTIRRHARRMVRRILDENTIEPTALPTRIFTSSPTSPTGRPSNAPTDRPTIFSEWPSSRPSTVPSMVPTNSSMPSEAPTLSTVPTISQEPSSLPSLLPSFVPSNIPSNVPSFTPSMTPTKLPSSEPTQSPTMSLSPTLAPTTLAPTTSSRPSNVPSVSLRPTVTGRPTNQPSTSPTLFPTDRPSVVPTVRPPTTSPSEPPTNRPSVSPSQLPSTIPTLSPTLSVSPLTQPKLTMRLEGRGLDTVEIDPKVWQNITSRHVLRFYQRYNEILKGSLPVNVTGVETTFGQSEVYPKNQIRRLNNNWNKNQESTATATNNVMVLEIEYEQTITLGQYRPIDDPGWIFVTPFFENSIDYILELMVEWDLDSLLTIDSVMVGEELMPTQSPVRIMERDGISTGGLVGISFAIVFAACLIVGFLFWNKSSKGPLPDGTMNQNGTHRIQEGAQPDNFVTFEFDNNNVRMISTPPRTPNRPTSIPMGSEYSNDHTTSTLESYQPIHPVEAPSSASPNQRRRYYNNRNHQVQSAPGLPSLNHVEANSEFTDSDGGGGLSDDGVDGAAYLVDPPTLPSISNTPDRFGVYTSPLSPLHIPDDEEGQQPTTLFPRPESNTIDSSPNVLGLSHSQSSPSLVDFGLQVQELE